MDINEILTTTEAKYSFIAGLIRLAKIDGIVDDKEFIFFQQAAYGIGLDSGVIEKLSALKESDTEIKIDFRTNKEKLFFLIQAVQLCLIDGSYSDVEKNELRNICAEMGISHDSLVKIENWACEGIAWNKRGEELLNLN